MHSCLFSFVFLMFTNVVLSQSMREESSNYVGIGDRLLHTYFSMNPLPLSIYDLKSAGYETDNICHPKLGVAWTKESSSIKMYFTSGGQIAGIGMILHDQPISQLVPSFWKPVGNSSTSFEITISFRNAEGGIMCGGSFAKENIGDGLWINQDTINMRIPLNVTDAAANQWTKGACIPKMGTHWAYDIQTHPRLSGQIQSLVPLLPMYNDDTGLLSAFLIHTNHLERVYPFGVWEGPFNSWLFCMNLCPPCNFDSPIFSTIHFFLTDPKLNVCGQSCTSSLKHNV